MGVRMMGMGIEIEKLVLEGFLPGGMKGGFRS